MNMRNIISISVFGCALVLGACDSGGDTKGDTKAAAADSKAGGDVKAGEGEGDGAGEEAVEADPLDPKVEKAVTLANSISASPGDADTILADAGMDRASFEQLLYEIAKDPELSKSYAIARDA